jgi:hypothetical protein
VKTSSPTSTGSIIAIIAAKVVVVDEGARRRPERGVAQPVENRIAPRANLQQAEERLEAGKNGHHKQEPHDVPGNQPLHTEEACNRWSNASHPASVAEGTTRSRG